MGTLIVIFLGLAGLYLYFLPIVVAGKRVISPSKMGWIFVLTVFAGWTIVGRLIAMGLATSGPKKPV